MDNVEVFASRLTHDPRVPLVHIQISGDVFPELLEDEGAAGEVETSEAFVTENLGANFWRRTRNELDNARWDTCLREDLMHNVVGVSSSR